jgi:hypothetical protein
MIDREELVKDLESIWNGEPIDVSLSHYDDLLKEIENTNDLMKKLYDELKQGVAVSAELMELINDSTSDKIRKSDQANKFRTFKRKLNDLLAELKSTISQGD